MAKPQWRHRLALRYSTLNNYQLELSFKLPFGAVCVIRTSEKFVAVISARYMLEHTPVKKRHDLLGYCQNVKNI